MKSNRFPLTPCASLRTIRGVLSSGRFRLAALAVAALASLPQYAPAQTDNFNSGALGPNWATSVSANFPGTISFPTDPYGGKAIRLVANSCGLATGNSIRDGTVSNPRIMAWRTDRLYTNFYVAADVLSWDTSINRDTNSPNILLIGRLTNVLRSINGVIAPVGRPDCMVLLLNVNRFGGPGGGTRGVINLAHLVNGGADNAFASLGLQGDFTLDPGHAYRMVLTGTNLVGNSVYYGRVYDLQDLTRPLATVFCPDSEFGSTPPWEAAGYSGIGTTSGDTNASTDVTLDNFVAAEYPPTSVSFPGTTNGEAGLPQVVNRTPASYSNFYVPAGGINFTATTLGGGNVTTAKLFLNGVDVSSSLNNPAAGNSRNFSFPGSGLTSNTVYDARIELANALGQKTTNVWTFDTFTDAFLAGTNYCKIIECEDFDFGAGQFIDNPVPSGWPTNTTYYNNFNTVAWPWPGATNQDLGGPPYTSYVNKGTASDLGVDYYDEEGHSGNQLWFADLRPLAQPSGSGQGPGTSEGDPSYQLLDWVSYWFPGDTGQNTMYVYDTQRQKYYDLDPVNHAIQEYMLDELEGGEWYNYSRTFASTNYYNVYLRHGSEFTEQLRLDQIVGGPTAPTATNYLGEFYATAALMKCNFRYTPLMTWVTPPNSLIANGNFGANALSFTLSPGYTGSPNPSSITSWTASGSAQYGINGAGTGVGDPFGPSNPGGLTYAFLQGTGQALVQSLTTLAPNTTYQLGYSVAGRIGNTASYRVVIYSDNTFTTAYYDSGVQPANSSGFVNVTASFTTPATLGAAPNIQLVNSSVAGDNTVDYANVFLVAGSSPVTTSKPAVVNLSGTNTLRLTVDVPQEERTKKGLMLNYMAFVPAFVVLSSSQVDTGYALDTTASINQNTRTITIPQNGPARYYRLRWDHQVTIKSITLVGGNVVLTYQ